MNGYIITDTGTEALELFEAPSVRFAASLDNGSGFVAFDDVIPPTNGRLLLAQEPLPDYPDTWPDWRRVGPKRTKATGREHFALISVDLLEYAAQTEAVTGIAYVGNDLLLIESDGPVVGGDVWNAGIVECKDKRLVSV